MVLLTIGFIERECSRLQAKKSLTRGIVHNHLCKITHLYMSDKFIHAISDISLCSNLRVIYLQYNNITKIENINFAVNLTHLYLQHNELIKIENLNTLRNLNNLHLGYNKINIIEGTENLNKLCQFYIPYQRLSTGESLIFDPRSLNTLSIHLTILNVAGNNITLLNPLKYFINLITLDARDNLIDDMLDLTETIETLKLLVKLFLHGNPIVQRYRYQENIIANSDSLVDLDGKIITDETRRFLIKFKNEKQLRLAKNTKATLSHDIMTSLKLPPAFKRSVSRAIIQQQSEPTFFINATSAIGETKLQLYPPWRSVASVIGMKNSHITPRPLWRAIPNFKHRQSSTTVTNNQVLTSLSTKSKSITTCLNK